MWIQLNNEKWYLNFNISDELKGLRVFFYFTINPVRNIPCHGILTSYFSYSIEIIKFVLTQHRFSHEIKQHDGTTH